MILLQILLPDCICYLSYLGKVTISFKPTTLFISLILSDVCFQLWCVVLWCAGREGVGGLCAGGSGNIPSWVPHSKLFLGLPFTFHRGWTAELPQVAFTRLCTYSVCVCHQVQRYAQNLRRPHCCCQRGMCVQVQVQAQRYFKNNTICALGWTMQTSQGYQVIACLHISL